MKENAYRFIELASQVHQKEQIVEYGSRRVADEQSKMNNLRLLFKGKSYLGLDATAGEGVDVVDDLVHSTLISGSVGTVLCCETLEHVFEVQEAAKQLIRIVSNNGLILVTVPSGDFPLHWFPDYWRMSPEAMDKLFESVPYRIVLFQGKFHAPHTVLGAFTFDSGVYVKVREHLFANMTSIPAYKKGEGIYLWVNAETYYEQRAKTAKSLYSVTYRY